jgi:uncharacterized membrane protein
LLNQFVFHWTPDRAVYIGAQSLPWDARCAGIYVGLGLNLILYLALRRHCRDLPSSPVLIVGAATMALPAVVDILSLLLELRTPSNGVRFVTGMLFGGYFCMYLYPAFRRMVSRPCRLRIDTTPVGDLRLALLLYVAIGCVVLAKVADTASAFYIVSAAAYVGFGGMLLIFVGGIVIAGVSVFRGDPRTPPGWPRSTRG